MNARCAGGCGLGRALSVFGIAMPVVFGAAAFGDEDWRKLADRQPAWVGPATTGQRLSPDALRADGYQASGISLLAHLPLSEFGCAGNGNSCFGYVSPSGREYAIMGTSDNTAYVEITDPLNPVVVATIPHTTSLWTDIKTYGSYAYTSNETGGGMQVIDMSDIDNGHVTLVRSVTANGLATIHTLAVNPESPFMYLAGSNMGNGSLAAFSLADPSNPTFAGRWSTAGQARYCHEAQVVSYTSGPLAGKEIAFAFDAGGGIDVLDITNKAAITRLSSTQYASLSYCHQGWLTADKQFLYVNDELDNLPATRIFQVSANATLTAAGSFPSHTTSIDHNLYIRGNYIFESNYRSGLRVFDATNRAAPVEIAFFDTYPADDSANFNGNWNNYPYFPSGTIILSDMERGLFIVSLDAAAVNFTTPVTLPEFVEANVPTTFTIRASPSATEPNPTDVKVHISVDDGPFSAIPMNPVVGVHQYAAQATMRNCGGQIRYFFSASNSLGETYTDPPSGSAAAYQARVVSHINVVDHMEAIGGWTVPAGAPNNTGSAGLFQFGQPEFTLAQPGTDHTGYPGENCWITGRTSGSFSNPGANDLDNGLTTLISPTFDLTGEETFVSYWRFYSNYRGVSPNLDTFRVDISPDGGASWVNAETVGPNSESTDCWLYHEFRVADIVSPTATMKLRFVAEDALPGSVVEAAVDDVTIFRVDCPPPPACPCDWTHSDGLDSQDYFEFLNGFFAGDADFNGDLTTDSQDFFEFLDCFFTGCSVGG